MTEFERGEIKASHEKSSSRLSVLLDQDQFFSSRRAIFSPQWRQNTPIQFLLNVKYLRQCGHLLEIDARVAKINVTPTTTQDRIEGVDLPDSLSCAEDITAITNITKKLRTHVRVVYIVSFIGK